MGVIKLVQWRSFCEDGEITSPLPAPRTAQEERCRDGRYSTSGSPGKNCKDCVKSCPAGQYLNGGKCTQTTSPSCEVCPKGYKCLGGVKAAQKCPKGYAQPEEGKGVCVKCGADKHSTIVGAETCDDIPAGYYGSAGQDNAHTAIEPCPAGTRCPGGSHDPIKCGFGTYQPEAGQSECLTCAVSDGVYQNRQGQRLCITPQKGSYVFANSRGGGERPCERGSYCRNGLKTLCPPGTYQTKSAQTVCMSCNSPTADGSPPKPENTEKWQVLHGSFSVDDCQLATTCAAGEYIAQDLVYWHDRVCLTCPPRYFGAYHTCRIDATVPGRIGCVLVHCEEAVGQCRRIFGLGATGRMPCSMSAHGLTYICAEWVYAERILRLRTNATIKPP